MTSQGLPFILQSKFLPTVHKKDYNLAPASFSNLISCHLPPYSAKLASLPVLEHAKKAPVSAPLPLIFPWLVCITPMAGSFSIFRFQIKCHLFREGFLHVSSKVALLSLLFPSYNFSISEIICLLHVHHLLPLPGCKFHDRRNLVCLVFCCNPST